MHLHLDCQFGIAGDMLLASLIDAGADQEKIAEILRSIPLDGFELKSGRTTRNGVAAMLVDVEDLTGVENKGRHTHDHEHDHHHHHHDHDRTHDHDHGHDHNHGHHHGKEHAHSHKGPHRHLSDLMRLLESDVLTPRIRERAGRVFHILAEAEATVHGQPLDKVHFHEISGIDTAVDVIGSCIAMELLDVDSVSASAPAVGSGMLMCEHGIFPIPAPATLEILKSHNVPWRAGGEGERATPTGIALLAALAESFGGSPEVIVVRIGYGAGHREFPDVPNLLRAIIGKPGRPESSQRRESKTIIAGAELEPSGEMVKVENHGPYPPAEIEALLPGDKTPEGDRVVEFRFAVDDMTPETLASLCESCLSGGAVDAYTLPAMMKKGRAGHEVTVLAPVERAAVVVDILWRESTTFGMRVGERSRLTLARDFRTVQVHGQKIRVKIGWRGGEIIRRQPEYEDCRAASLATGRPLTEIFSLAAGMAAGIE